MFFPLHTGTAGEGEGGVGTRWATLEGTPEFISGFECNATDCGPAVFNNSQITYDATKAAAKVTFVGEGPSGTSPGTFELVSPEYARIGTPYINSGTIVASIDFWLDPTMAQEPAGNQNSLINLTWKSFQFLLHDQPTSGDPNIAWELRINSFSGTSTHAYITGFRTYHRFSTGQTANEPTAPRGLDSEVYGNTNGHPGAIIPYGQWVRLIHVAELNLDETHFADWDAMEALGQRTGGPLAAGNYHRMTSWLQVGTTKYCLMWKFPLQTLKPLPSTIDMRYAAMWGTEFDSSSEHERSTGVVRFTGVDGSVIPNNTRIWTLDGTQKFNVQGNWTIGAVTPGLVDADVEASIASSPAGTKTSGFASNKPSGTEFTFVRAAGGSGTQPAGVDDASFAQGDFTGGTDVFLADAYLWFRHNAILHNYPLPSDPTDDPVLFEAI